MVQALSDAVLPNTVTGVSRPASTDGAKGVGDKEKTGGSSSDFDTFLKGLLTPDGSGQVCEEDLFSALVQERVSGVKGEEGLEKFKALLAEKRSALQGPGGYVSSEAATVAALKASVAAGDLTQEEADKIYSEAFASAQLDSNLDTLYDGKGGANDPTMAVAALEAALLSARTKIEELAANGLGASALTLAGADETGRRVSGAGAADASGAAGVSTEVNGTTVDGPDGFLFKPISENQGTLAVLMPEALKELVESVVLRDASGAEIESGTSTGYGDLGTREKFSFSKPGGNYPAGVVVEARLKDGTTKTWTIPDPSRRYD